VAQTLAAYGRLVEHKGKCPFEPVDHLERRMRCLNVRQAWPRRDETKIGHPDGGGCNIVITAGRVDDRERVAPPHERPQRTLELKPVSNPFHRRVGISSAYAPVRDGAWASVSNMHTRSPSSMAATAKPMESVDFPVPPF
jgi:hypothetical protein